MSSDIVFTILYRYVLILFSDEKVRSSEAVDIGSVDQILNNLLTPGLWVYVCITQL